MRTRIIAVALIKNEKEEYLILKMPKNFGPYPGQWGIIGGGIEAGEKIEDAVKREVWEESGLNVVKMKPLFFAEDSVEKLLRDGTKEKQYLIFLLHEVYASGELQLNDEWETSAWVPKHELKNYDLNKPTIANFEKLGLI